MTAHDEIVLIATMAATLAAGTPAMLRTDSHAAEAKRSVALARAILEETRRTA